MQPTQPESTDGFVGSTVGAGWRLGWCVCAGRRVLGRAKLVWGAGAGWWRWGCLLAAPGRGGRLDELGQVADVSQGGGEGCGRWPVERQARSVSAAVVDEAARHGEEPVVDGGRGGELRGGVGVSGAGGSAGGVVGGHAAGELGAVGGELSGGAAAEPGVFFEVANGEFDGGVGSVVGVGGDGVEVGSVGDEAVVAPVGPHLGLGAEQAGAAHDEPQLGPLAVGAAELVAAAAGVDGGLSGLGLRAAGVWAIVCQASSPMAATAALTLALYGIVIE